MIKLKKLIRENSFEGGGGGASGTLNYQGSMLGTFNSPDVSQNPASFHSSNHNKYYDPDKTGQPTINAANKSGSFDTDIEQLFQGKEKPTIDDINTGIDYELGQMIHKDMSVAKELVIRNMKQFGPKYYSSLGMMNIDEPSLDKNMEFDMKNDVNLNLKETVDVLNKMIEEKKARRMETNPEILNILNQKRQEKLERFDQLLKRISS